MAVQNQVTPDDTEAMNKKDEEKKWKKTEAEKAEAKSDKEKREVIKKARLKNGVTFVRKDTRPGIYSTNGIGKRLKIRDRGHYFTKIDSEIKFFDNDSEIVELDPKSPKK